MDSNDEIKIKAATLIVAVVAAFYTANQFRMQKRINKAKFISDLSNSMASESLTNAVQNLEKYRDALYSQMQEKEPFATHAYVIIEDPPSDSYLNEPDSDEKKKMEEDYNKALAEYFPADMSASFREAHLRILKEWSNVRNLVRFYESIMYMIETGAVKERDIFPLMGYRMFLVLNCPLIQKRLLYTFDKKTERVRFKYSFLAIFGLHEKLVKYHKNRFKWKDDKGVKYDLLLEDYRVHERYDLERSSSFLWQANAYGSGGEVYAAALAAYRKYKYRSFVMKMFHSIFKRY